VSDSSKNLDKIPNTVVDLLVSDIFRKHGVTAEKVKKNLSEEQKKMLKELVEDLSKRVDTFVNTNTQTQKSTDSNN
jgi:spore coat protein W